MRILTHPVRYVSTESHDRGLIYNPGRCRGCVGTVNERFTLARVIDSIREFRKSSTPRPYYPARKCLLLVRVYPSPISCGPSRMTVSRPDNASGMNPSTVFSAHYYRYDRCTYIDRTAAVFDDDFLPVCSRRRTPHKDSGPSRTNRRL